MGHMGCIRIGGKLDDSCSLALQSQWDRLWVYMEAGSRLQWGMRAQEPD